jgi:hypothetical protein
LEQRERKKEVVSVSIALLDTFNLKRRELRHVKYVLLVTLPI